MAATGSAFRIKQIQHGSVTLSGPAGGWVRERVEFLALRAGTLAGPAGLAAVVTGVTAEAEVTDLDDNIAAGVKDTLSFTLKEASGGTATVSITGMVTVHREVVKRNRRGARGRDVR